MSKETTIFIDTEDMEERYGEELYKEYLEKENEKLNHYKLLYQKVKERNDKAIEFVEELYDNTDDITCYDIDRNTRDDLLEILKGENNE